MRPASIRQWLVGVVATAAGLALGWWGFGVMRPQTAPHKPTSGPIKPPRPPGRAIDPLATGIAHIWAAGDASAQTAAAVAWARALAPADFGRALESLDRLPAHAAQGMAKHAILNRWAAHDPAAALRWTLGHDPELVGTVAGAGIRNDPACVESILSVLSSLTPGERHRNALVSDAVSQIFNKLATHDREVAMNLLKRRDLLPSDRPLSSIAHSLRAMAHQDPAWMLERADSLPVDDRASIRASVARALADADPLQAVSWARSQPDSPALIQELLRQPKDVPALIAGLATLSAEEQASMRLSGLSWGQSDPKAVVDSLEKQANHLSQNFLEFLLSGSAVSLINAEEPGALANRLLALSAVPKTFPLTVFVDLWAGQEPDAARAWASALVDETQLTEALEAVDKATRREEEIPSPPSEPTLSPAEPILSPMEQALAQVNIGKLLEPYALLVLTPDDRRRVMDAAWAKDLAAEAIRATGDVPVESTGEVLPRISRHYPAETARWLSDTLTAESTSALIPVLTSTAAHWASEDPRAAAAWAATLPPGQARAWAAVNVFHQWRYFDETNARTWWESLPAEERARTSR